MQTQNTIARFTSVVRGFLAACFLLGGVISAQGKDAVQITWTPNAEPDLAGYTIRVGSSSGEYTETYNVTSTSLTITGLAPFTTYYCVILAVNHYGLTGESSQELAFSTTTAGESYLNWTKIYGLTGDSALPGGTPFGDGVSNLLKFAFNLDPSRPGTYTLADGYGASGLPCYSVVTSGSQTYFQVEYIRRKGIDLQYDPLISTDLRSYQPMTGTTTITSIDDMLERVITRQAVNPRTAGKLFGRVAVTLP